jgi:hypothetical protein
MIARENVDRHAGKGHRSRDVTQVDVHATGEAHARRHHWATVYGYHRDASDWLLSERLGQKCLLANG